MGEKSLSEKCVLVWVACVNEKDADSILIQVYENALRSFSSFENTVRICFWTGHTAPPALSDVLARQGVFLVARNLAGHGRVAAVHDMLRQYGIWRAPCDVVITDHACIFQRDPRHTDATTLKQSDSTDTNTDVMIRATDGNKYETRDLSKCVFRLEFSDTLNSARVQTHVTAPALTRGVKFGGADAAAEPAAVPVESEHTQTVRRAASVVTSPGVAVLAHEYLVWDKSGNPLRVSQPHSAQVNAAFSATTRGREHATTSLRTSTRGRDRVRDIRKRARSANNTDTTHTTNTSSFDTPE